MAKQRTLKFLIDNIQLFADEEQLDYGLLLDDDVTEEEPNKDDLEDKEEKESEKAATADEGKKEATQSRSENAKYAQKRREAEAKEKANNQPKTEQEAELQGYIKGSGGINTFTGLPIEDEEDVHLFELMKEADARGDDPVKEGYKQIREERIKAKKEATEREQKTKAEEESRKQSTEAATKNIKALRDAHPECDLKWFKEQWKDTVVVDEDSGKQVKQQSKFKELVLHGFTPIQAYNFLGLGKKQDVAAPSTPSLTSGGESSGKKSVKDMTPDEYEQYALSKYGTI